MGAGAKLGSSGICLAVRHNEKGGCCALGGLEETLVRRHTGCPLPTLHHVVDWGVCQDPLAGGGSLFFSLENYSIIPFSVQ